MFSVLAAATLGVEFVNYVYYRTFRSFVSQNKEHPENMEPDKLLQYFANLTAHEMSEWIDKSFSYKQPMTDSYYKSVPIQILSKSNMTEWISSFVYHKSYSELKEEQEEKVNNLLDVIETKLEHNFIEYDNDHLIDNIYFLQFGKNKIKSKYKPLTVYAGFSLMKHVTLANLKMHGYKEYRSSKANFTYLYYKSPENKSTTLFLHGFGLGIVPYVSWLKDITKKTNVIAPIFPNISNMDFTSVFNHFDEESLFPTYETWREDFKSILINHNIEQIDVIGHSFGTIIFGIILKDPMLKSRINKKLFVDPVCFIDEYYKISRYINEPVHYDCVSKALSVATDLLIYNDVYVRYVTQRYLYGPEYWILDYDILKDNKSVVVLSEDDAMVPSLTIFKKLTQNMVPCLLVEGAIHSDIFTNKEFQCVRDYIIDFVAFC